ncbi:hypothetical protein Y032_0066g3713 [Ancylostoma ceylanicum]|uniref:Uncharacterized protein n=1 Tax=Ancylostoma ceylanicum TaxID=53326 RepID=A0A016TZZ6_9BILA|nr:hypothetical protein Y032_0066g3713 [Ancylostoma ceylanicum]
MAVNYPRPRQRRRATAPRPPESMSSATVLLSLGALLPNYVILTRFPCFIARNSITPADGIDSGARGVLIEAVDGSAPSTLTSILQSIHIGPFNNVSFPRRIIRNILPK